MAIDIDPPDWGDTGTKPPDGLEFDGGDTYNAQYADWLWYNFGQLIEQTNQSLNENLNATSYKGNDIDSDGDGCVNCAEFSQSGNATSYKGNDIDVDGDGVVNTAHDVEKWYRSTDIPKTEIQPGNYAIGRELYVPDGWEIYFYESALEPDETPIPNGLEIIAADVTRDVTFSVTQIDLITSMTGRIPNNQVHVKSASIFAMGPDQHRSHQVGLCGH